MCTVVNQEESNGACKSGNGAPMTTRLLHSFLHPSSSAYLVCARQLGVLPSQLSQQVPEVHEGVGKLGDEERERDVSPGPSRGPTRPGAYETGAMVEELHPVVSEEGGREGGREEGAGRRELRCRPYLD